MDRAAERHPLRVGAEFVLRLPGRGGAGYGWQCELGGDRDAVSVAVSSAPQVAGSPPVTGGVDEVFTLRGLKPGHVEIRFALRRSWEAGAAPLQERQLGLDVHA